MKYKVDGWNNFCRIFELPPDYPKGFCFGGGKPVIFQMVDWFDPVPGLPNPAVSKKEWGERVGKIEVKEVSESDLHKELVEWLRKKSYVKKDRRYLIICDFGAAVIFNK